MEDGTGLICGFVLDGRGGGTELDWDGIRSWTAARGPLWLHLDYARDDSRAWLLDESGLDRIVVSALMQSEPRPRCLVEPEGMLLVERVINLNEGAEPEDMVSVRIWLDEHRIITLRHRRVNALKSVRADLRRGIGPTSPAQLLAVFTERVLDRIGRVVESIDEAVDDLEDRVLLERDPALRPRLGGLRRQAIALRRYIAPQRDVLSRLFLERTALLDDDSRQLVRESADRLTRYVEDLDAARDRAAVTAEELSSQQAELMNQRLYVLALVAALFLPLGLVTGLWGVNVGGVPGLTYRWGFWVLGGGIAALAVAQLLLFRKLRWL